MKILLIAQELPSPPDNGFRWKTYNLLCSIGGRHECHVMAFAPAPPPPGAVRKIADLPGIKDLRIFQSTRTSALSMLKALFRHGLASVAAYDSEEFRAALRDELRNQYYDLVVLDMINMTVFAPIVSPCPTIFSVNDAVSLGYWNYAKAGGRLLTRARFALAAWFIKQYEKKCYSQAGAVHVVSEADSIWLQNIGCEARLEIIGQAVSEEYLFPDEPIPIQLVGKIVIPARRYDSSSLHAAERFAEKSFPEIAEIEPGVELEIIGHSGDRGKGFSKDPRVHYSPWIQDYRAALLGSVVIAFPESGGAGVKTRILQAMAVRRPVVMTPQVAYGMGCRDGVECMVATTTHEFAVAVLTLLRDRDLAARLSEAARNYVVDRHSLARIAEKWNALFLKVAGERVSSTRARSLPA